MRVLKSIDLVIAGMIALFAVGLLFAVSSEAKIDPESVMGMWLFDEEDNIVIDSSGNGLERAFGIIAVSPAGKLTTTWAGIKAQD
jgi:hypothetical protein